MRGFGRFAIFTTIATYFLIFMGGLVRVSGAGLGCPDWPKCFGRWIPPVSISQLPPEIDASAFNLTLAWIEYINRFFGVTVGFLILALAISAIAGYRSNPKILIPAVLAAVLTAFQGWQGSQLVASGLKPIIVSVHMVIALIIAGLLIYLSLQAYFQSRIRATGEYPKGIKPIAGILLSAVLAQNIIGTQFRQAIETSTSHFPFVSPAEIISNNPGLKNIHALFGIAVMLLAAITSYKLLSRSSKPSPLVWQAAWCMAGLAFLQIIVGAILLLIGIPPVAQVLHMWISTLLFGVILIAYLGISRERSSA